MAQISIEQIYSGGKYSVISAAVEEYMLDGRHPEYDERTRIDLLMVKRVLIVADKMKTEGDLVAGLIDDESPSSYAEYVRWNENDITPKTLLRNNHRGLVQGRT